jgi:predicted dehydrogenase
VTLRVGLVGCGLVAQAMHLPYLLQLHERFEVAAVADPSARVREAAERRFGIGATYADHRALLEAGLDAVFVCTPPASHTEVTLDALAAGLHVFVEKPLCLTREDADRIVAARAAAGRVVQVGYMKRFDPAYEAMLEELPGSLDELVYVSVLVADPEHEPYFSDEALVRAEDLPSTAQEAMRAEEARQVKAAVGSGDPVTVRAFSDGFLGSLVHQVNLVHGLLERMGQPPPSTVIAGDWWADGRAVSGAVRLPNDARWDSAWVQLLSLSEYDERIRLFFRDSVRSLVFPSPWLKHSPTVYEYSASRDGARVTRRIEAYQEAFERQLLHFHDCVVRGLPCRTPPEQARVDMEVLKRMFLAKLREPNRSPVVESAG